MNNTTCIIHYLIPLIYLGIHPFWDWSYFAERRRYGRYLLVIFVYQKGFFLHNSLFFFGRNAIGIVCFWLVGMGSHWDVPGVSLD